MMMGQGPAQKHYWIIYNRYEAFTGDLYGSIGYEYLFDLLWKLGVVDEDV